MHAKGQLDEAIAAFRQAIALKPDYPRAYNNLGAALKEVGQLDAAIAAYQNAIAHDPTLPEAHYNLGNVLHAHERLDEAVDAYRRAIALRPNFPDAHNSLGDALEGQGQIDSAIAAYKQAIALQPDDCAAYNNLVLVRLFKEHTDQATTTCMQTAYKPQAGAALGQTVEDVTLLCIDCIDPAGAARVLERRGGLRFGAVKLLSHDKPTQLADGIE